VRALERHAALLAAGGEIVTATPAQAQALKLALGRGRAAAGETVWPTPRIVPLGAWLERAALALDERPALLEPATSRRLWQRIVAESRAAAPLISARAAAADAERAFALLAEWRLDPAAVEPSTPERRAFRGWARRFTETCEAEGLIDRARLGALVLGQAPAALGTGGPVGWHGFAQPTPLRAALEAALAALGRPSEALALAAGPAAIESAVPETPEAELALIAGWAEAELRREPRACLGVVLPELGAAGARLARELDDRLAPALKAPGAPDARPYVLGAGRSLAEHALVATALAALALGEPAVDVPTLGRVLRSPYLALAAGAEPAADDGFLGARLDARLRSVGARTLLPREAVEALRAAGPGGQRVAAALLESWRLLESQQPLPATTWAERFPRALRALGWPLGRALGATESLAAEELYAALAAFAGLARVLPPLALGEARTEFEALVAARRFEPEHGAAPVRVVDGLADPAVPFDALWVAGLTVERFPAPAAPNPFLPPALQREQAMPGASAELALAEAEAALAGWRRSAPRLVLSAPRRDGDATLLRSTLLPPAPEYRPPDVRAGRAAQILAAAALEPWTDAGLPAVAAGVALGGGVRVLELQSECPFRAGAELRLGAGALESPTPGIPRRVRGTLAHQALRRFWEALRTHAALVAESAEGRAARARAAVDAALGGHRGHLPRGTLLELERRWLVQALIALAEAERGRPAFEVIALEQREPLELGGHRLETRLDRLDRLATGETVLIDYKTGRGSPRRWAGERPDVMQLAAYAAFREPAPAAIALARLALSLEPSKKFVARAADPALLPGARRVDGGDWPAQLAEWRATAARLAAEFAAGRAAVDPVPGACERCALATLCRIEERATDEVAAAEDGAAAEAGP